MISLFSRVPLSIIHQIRTLMPSPTSPMLQIVLAIVGGLVAHHVFLIHGEWHLSGHHIVVSHVLLGSCLLYLSSQVHDKLEHAISWTALSIACYFGALFGSMTIYRLFFHKTSHFPGPKWASITKFWHIYQVRDSRNYLFQERLFKKYGTFVRTGK